MVMQYREQKILFAGVFLLVCVVALVITSIVVAHYQGASEGGVFVHVFIGAVIPLMGIANALFSLAFAIMLTAYQYLQTIQYGSNNDGNILQYAAGFAVVALLMAIVKYIYEPDGFVEHMIEKKKKYPREKKGGYQQLTTDLPTVNGIPIFGKPVSKTFY